MNNGFDRNVYLVPKNVGALPGLYALLKQEGISTQANPDLYQREHAMFGIDDAIDLRQRALRRAVSGGRRVFIISANDMTREAQNALLKTLEEPSADALFFFLVPTPATLLPTLRSRAQILVFENEKKPEEIIDVGMFLKTAPSKRIDMLKVFLEKDKDDRRDLGAIINFLSSLEVSLFRSPEKHKEGIHAIYRTRRYITDRGALIKPLLEYVALMLPVM